MLQSRPMSAGGRFEGEARGLGGREIVVWTVAAFLLFCGWRLVVQSPLSNDSYQYLSVAENIAAGRGIETSLVHFDIERAHGTIPTPLTTFSAGFPAVIAVLSRVGVSPPAAAVAISLLSMTLVMTLLGVGCNLLELDVWVARGVLLLFALNANMMMYAGVVLSEAPFTLLTVAAAIAAVAAERAERARSVTLLSLAAGLAAGLSYWVRYAGLLVIAGLGLALGVLFLARRTRRSFQTVVVTLVAAIVPVAIGIARNLHLTGTWQGGNTKVIRHPLGEMVKKTVTSFWHLFVGDAVSRPARLGQVLFVLALGFVVLRWRRKPRGPVAASAFILAAVAGVYSVLMFYVGMHSVISYASRMFLPVPPLLLLAAGSMIEPPARVKGTGVAVALAGLAGYALCGPLSFGGPVSLSPDAQIASRLGRPGEDGRPLSAWIDAHIDAQEPLMAAEGQATGHLLHRPTLSLVEVEYSDLVWNEQTIEQTMDRFGIRYLILYSGSGKTEGAPFLASLVAGQPDAHLKLAAHNDQSFIFEHPRAAR